MTQCGKKKEDFTANKNNTFSNSVVENFASNNTGSAPTDLIGWVADFGGKLIGKIGLFAILFIILFVRQNYFDPKSIPSVLIFVGIVSAAFVILQYVYPEMNGFIIAGIGVSVGMAMFKDQFSTVFINNSSAKLN